MTVTVTSARGLDSDQAIIVGQMMDSDARAYCTEYVGADTPKCRADYTRTARLVGFIQADCQRGNFSTFYGAKLLFVGPHRKEAADDAFTAALAPEYDIIDVARGQPLDGSSASGYGYDLEQFKALCPSRLR